MILMLYSEMVDWKGSGDLIRSGFERPLLLTDSSREEEVMNAL